MVIRLMLAAVLAGWGLVAWAAAPPNVIILLTDDQGYGDLSAHGNPVLKTPNLDRLHSESVRFTDFHVAPMCTPTRGQLLTGMDALRNGATSVAAGRSMIHRGIGTMPEMFAAGGYKTALIGKWHLGDNYPYRPMDRGFQTAKYFYGWGLASAPEFDNDYFDGRYLDQGVQKNFTGYCTDFWFNESIKWMKERKEKNEPFFLYLPTNTPHGPAWVDAKYADPFKEKKGLPANFYGMIVNLDENVGRLEAFLAESGLRENTIVIFMTDNGGTAGVRTYNAGMRAGKTTYYDGGHRVPCFVRWPAGKLGAPRDVATPTQIQDLLPTLIDLCGLKKAEGARFDGLSLAGVLKDPAASLPERMLVVQYGQILKKGESCVIWNKWRLVHDRELYDLASDPGQTRDVAAANPQIAQKLHDHYEQWWKSIEPGLSNYPPISIGAAGIGEVTLTSSDWQDVYCDNTKAVRDAIGGPRGGPWNVQVETEGRYQIELRRWPRHVDLALSAGIAEQKTRVGVHPAGKALAIAGARVSIAGQELQKSAGAADKSVTFEVSLKAGRTQLQAWFVDGEGKELSGVFYAYVSRK